MNELTIEYCGEQYVVPTDREFSFGRSSDLEVDSNRYLHRCMGTFRWTPTFWWLANVGSHLPLHLEGRAGGTSVTLAPGSSLPLVFGSCYLRFAAGGTTYELLVDAAASIGPFEPPLSRAGETTVDASDMPLTPEQLLLLIALAEPRLRKGALADLPSNADIAARFGWPITKFNRKLDNLCAKFARRGVDGLVSSRRGAAQNRRSALVEHVVTSGLLTVDQLALLPQMTRRPD